MSYSSEVLALSPSAYYRLNEASGLIQDSSVNARHATSVIGTATYSQTGLVTSDPTNNCVQLGGAANWSVPDLGLDLADIFTMMAIIKKGANGSTLAIVAKGTGAYYMGFGANDRLELAKDSVALIVQSTTTITDTGIHHVAITKTGATSKLYIDAVDVTGTVTDATCVDNAIALLVGQGGGAFWTGHLDEVAIFPTALSQAQVQTIYDAAQVVGSPPTIRIGRSSLRW